MIDNSFLFKILLTVIFYETWIVHNLLEHFSTTPFKFKLLSGLYFSSKTFSNKEGGNESLNFVWARSLSMGTTFMTLIESEIFNRKSMTTT